MPSSRVTALRMTETAWIRGCSYLKSHTHPSVLGLRLRGYASVTVGHVPIRLTCRGFPGGKSAGILAFRSHLQMLARGKWEPEVLSFLGRILGNGDVFIDVGAWMGVHSLYASALVGEKGKVVSFEPDPVARTMLRRNIALNHDSNVELRSEALSDVVGNTNLVPVTTYGMSYSRILEQTSSVGISIQTITLDHFVSKSGLTAKIVKIDVEGFEDKVIDGGEHTLSDPDTSIVLEFHSRQLAERGQDPRSVFRSLFRFEKDVLALASQTRLHEGDPIPGETGCSWDDGHLALVP